MTETPTAPPATFVIFGVLGDLAGRLLVPAVVNLARACLLDERTRFVGVDHGEGDDAKVREHLSSLLEDGPEWRRVSRHLTYLRGDFADPALFANLARSLHGDVVFYLATAPDFFGPIIDGLGEAKLLDEATGFRRVVIEKPFGTDLTSARALNKLLLARTREKQIYRIDHFLGKETVQNIMVARFGNALAEAIWNNRFIDHIQITVAESIGVGSRGRFYDATGALRDMVPSHLLQLLAVVAMEPPNSLHADAIRDEKAKVIAAIVPVKPTDAIRGRYSEGRMGQETLPAYLDTPDVDPKSRTETYVAMKLAVETWRWAGVPFYLRTGKALAARDTEIVIRFRHPPLALFGEESKAARSGDQLVLQLQPHEGMHLDIAVKRPGPLMETDVAHVGFAYESQFDLSLSTGYETLLYDVLIGDQTLFQRAEQVEGGWRVVQPLLDAWRTGEPEDYAPGEQGPDAAAALLGRDGRAWHYIA